MLSHATGIVHASTYTPILDHLAELGRRDEQQLVGDGGQFALFL